MRVVKDYFPYLEKAICNLVNRSIIEQSFPEVLKQSKIIPILKPGKLANEMGSYRPINLLPSLSKVIEKVVFGQFVDHLQTKQILTHHLHGSRPSHSTTIYMKI